MPARFPTRGPTPAHPFVSLFPVDPFTGVLFSAGFSFTDGVTTASDVASLQALYLAHGATEVYARISTEKTPTGSPDDHSEQTALERAMLARSAWNSLQPRARPLGSLRRCWLPARP